MELQKKVDNSFIDIMKVGKLDSNAKVFEHDNMIEVHSKAHTLSVNTGIECTYDLSKGESPLPTLRLTAIARSVQEARMIYQKQTMKY